MVAACSNLLETGRCTDRSCALRHGAFVCAACSFVSNNRDAYTQHLATKTHGRKTSGGGRAFYCPVCRVSVSGAYYWGRHVAGQAHARAADQVGVAPDSVQPLDPGATVDGHDWCETCRSRVPKDGWERHRSTRRDEEKTQVNTQVKNAEAVLADATANKHGVTVSHHPNVDFGVVKFEQAKTGVRVTLTVETAVPQSSIRMRVPRLTLDLAGRPTPFSVSIEGTTTSNGGIRLVHGKPLRVFVTFKRESSGICKDRLELTFVDKKGPFVIVRTLHAVVGDKEQYEQLQPKAVYVPQKRSSRDPELEIVRGVPPPALRAVTYVVALPKAPIPDLLAKKLGDPSSSLRHKSAFVDASMPSTFDATTYARYFKMVLWVEECRSDQDLQVYDISSTKLVKNDSYYFLSVPGLAEKRPSVLVGDHILVQPTSASISKDKWFEGRVHAVRRLEVGMKFDPSFPEPTPKTMYRVRFKLNRQPLQRQHLALDTLFALPRILFPTSKHLAGLPTRAPSATGLRVFNKLIANNPPQMQAVASILSLPPGSPPFAVFGPPGTGKTVTIIEAIRQILAKDPKAKVLACAPSNSAADIIAERLTMLGPNVLFRFYAASREKVAVPDALRAFTRETPEGYFTAPAVPTLQRFRVVVATCVSTAFAHGVGVPRGHFSHIFVDEAGQATEPEVMVGIQTMADHKTNVVLSGDPKQLGPIVRSAIARKLGLEKSYFERIMDSGIYDAKRGYGITTVQLVQNFRSHPSILQFPNEQFYKNTLVPHGDKKIIDSYLGSPILVNPSFPIVFHNLPGKDDQDQSSPSFFNVLEALEVKRYVERLRFDRRIRISDHDIGVITPYHAQCQKIRTVLRGFADQVKVGSVEEFQGQERRIIIISTVRSSPEFIEYDMKHTLGFLANPRRLNVSVTRAQALLIIIGDSSVLSLDPLWRSFLNYIHLNSGWCGDEPIWDTRAPVKASGGYDAEVRQKGIDDMNEFMRRMEKLTLQGIADDVEEEENADRPWREVE